MRALAPEGRLWVAQRFQRCGRPIPYEPGLQPPRDLPPSPTDTEKIHTAIPAPPFRCCYVLPQPERRRPRRRHRIPSQTREPASPRIPDRRPIPLRAADDRNEQPKGQSPAHPATPAAPARAQPNQSRRIRPRPRGPQPKAIRPAECEKARAAPRNAREHGTAASAVVAYVHAETLGANGERT